MFKGLNSIIYKETFHILRDPRTLFLMLLIPGMDMLIFGYAIDLDVRNVATVVYNLDGRRESRELLETFENAGTFRIVRSVPSQEALVRAIVGGDARVGIAIPPDYTDRLLAGRDVSIQVLLDGSDSTVAMQALNVSNAIALRESLDYIADQAGLPEDALPIEARTRVLFNPDMKTPNFMVPALVAIVMQLVTLLLTAFAIVREKETGTLEQLMVTPVSRFGLMLGKLLPYGVIGAVDAAFCLVIMYVIFGVAIEGSLTLLAAFSVLFLFANLGVGLFVSTIATNQMQAVQLAFVFILPSVLLSGFMFPQESMPPPIYAIGQLIPATYFIRILRGIILRGAGFPELWDQGAWLLLIGLVIVVISAARFRKTSA